MNRKLILYGTVPSKKNSKRRVQRGAHVFMIPSENHEIWHRQQMLFLRSWNDAPMPKLESVTLTFYVADKRKADLSNKAESVMDLLVDAGVILDDNYFVVPELHLLLGGVDKKSSRVEIELDSI